MDFFSLLKEARNAKKMSYSPYSNFRVGAAILTSNNKIYTGTNIENSSYGATVCAERVAIFKAISDGEKKIKTIAITSDKKDIVFPCGICRQVISEFALKEIEIVCSTDILEFKVYSLSDIMPNLFHLEG
jgi:cytidine deaminase